MKVRMKDGRYTRTFFWWRGWYCQKGGTLVNHTSMKLSDITDMSDVPDDGAFSVMDPIMDNERFVQEVNEFLND